MSARSRRTRIAILAADRRRPSGGALPLLLGVVALGAAAPGLALAQVATGATNGVQGAFAGVQSLEVELTMSATHESNAAHVAEAEAKERGLQVADDIFAPGLNFDISHRIGRGAAFLSGSAAYDFYQRDHVLNRDASDLRGGLGLRAAGCQTDLTTSYNRRRNDLAATTVAQVQATTSVNSVQLDATCGANLLFAPTASVVESWQKNTGAELQSSNSRTTGGSIGLLYQGLTEGSLSASLTAQRTEFTDRPANPAAFGGTRYDLHAATLTYQRGLGARLSGALSVGYTQADPHTGNKFSGATYEASLSYLAGSRLSFDGVFERSVIPSNQIGGTFQVERSSRLQGKYRLGGHIILTAGASQLHGQEMGRIVFLPTDLRDFRDTTEFGRISADVSKFIFSLAVENEERNTNQPLLNYTDVRTSIMLSRSF